MDEDSDAGVEHAVIDIDVDVDVDDISDANAQVEIEPGEQRQGPVDAGEIQPDSGK